MTLSPPRSTRTDTLFLSTSRFRSSLAVPSGTLRPARAALPWIDGVLVQSPKAGRRLARFLMECGDLWHGTAFCISHAAAEPISAVTREPVLVAQFPTENALIALVGRER